MRGSDRHVTNALSFDVEEHFQVHAFEHNIARASWDHQSSRVAPATRRILRALRDHRTTATFFVLGWVADRHPWLVEEIAADGHEVATHGYAHELVYRQTPDEFARDLDASLRAIERALGEHVVRGYRAPGFSITTQSLWALDELARQGLTYDSSIFPLSAHDRYGIPGARRFAHRLANGLLEVPASTVRIAGLNVPVAGGGYFRLYPTSVTARAIHHLNRHGHPAVVYLHPWEFDPEQSRVEGASRLSRFRHYTNLDKTEVRLRELLERFHFSSVAGAFASELSQAPQVASEDAGAEGRLVEELARAS